MGFTTASVVNSMRGDIIKVSTGCKEFDDILEGGFETGTITEVYGENRSGKTQMMHTLCVTCQVRITLRNSKQNSKLPVPATLRDQKILAAANHGRGW